MKKLILFVVVIVLIIISVTYFKKPNNQAINLQDQNSTGQNIVNTASTTKTYSLSDIASRNKPTDCWTIVNGKVYDLTAWINKHPGGDQSILSICGIDGSNAFNKQHGGQGKPEKTLEGFYIGELAK